MAPLRERHSSSNDDNGGSGYRRKEIQADREQPSETSLDWTKDTLYEPAAQETALDWCDIRLLKPRRRQFCWP